jgi:eukaryotic-like serine/threonine-protein kinase
MIDPTSDHTNSDHSFPDNSESQTAATRGDYSLEGAQQTPIPKSIGRYRILSLIGEGGMGSVYKAEQESPRRTVALKVIKAGVASPRLLHRFEIEAQILGKLDHPGIATIYEAGTFDEGRGTQPFFAMEFVEGQLLNQYAESRKLGTRDRLALLAMIADAVQHAHQKGVIHRDLKPGNILVTNEGQIKILDFGVARATDADIQTATMQTDIGQLVGTIPYMSPEQASGNPDDLDTRSDVYALGVVAYELLTGEMPYDLKQKMIHEAVRVIQYDEPKTLSAINRIFRGDVEIMVSKALVKEKERRYQSASDFACDINRFLNNEPIIARPPSSWYQISKFTKRNKAVVTGVLGVMIVSIVGAAVSISFAIGEAEQKQIALKNSQAAQSAQLLAENRLREAERQRAISDEINRFLNDDLLAKAAPESNGSAGHGSEYTVREALEEAIKSLNEQSVDLPAEVVAGLEATIGRALLSIGVPNRAAIQLRNAIEKLEEISTTPSQKLAELKLSLSVALFRIGNSEEAAALSAESVEMIRSQLDPDDDELLDALVDHASSLKWNGQLEEAIMIYEQVLHVRSSRDNANLDSAIPGIEYNLALALEKTGDPVRYKDGVVMMERALVSRTRLLGESHLSVFNTQAELGRMIRNTDPARAEVLYRDALAGMRVIRSDEHWRNRQVAVNLGTLIAAQERYEEAFGLLVDAVEGYRQYSGPAAGDTLAVTGFLVYYLQVAGRHDEAISQIERAIDLVEQVEGLSHEDRQSAIGSIDAMRVQP